MNGNSVSPAYRLAGIRLEDEWDVGLRLSRDEDDTGGRFSVGYEVRRKGLKAFLKAIDLRRSLLTDSGVMLTRALLGGQIAEADVLHRCAEAGLSRVIAPLGSGVWADPRNAGATPVPYIITEWADGGDLRRLLTRDEMELSFAFGVLHDLAVGVQQIHRERISHHDLKPSNAVIVGRTAKLADFGHAMDHAADVEGVVGPGTLAYAPPEVLYRELSNSWDACRAIDLYHLGSMVGSVFLAGVPVTALWLALLDEEIHPANFGGSFEDALPFVIDAFTRSTEFLESRLPSGCPADRVLALVRQLCWPDPRRRGHRKEQTGAQDPYGLRRIVSELNLLAKTAALEGSLA